MEKCVICISEKTCETDRDNARETERKREKEEILKTI